MVGRRSCGSETLAILNFLPTAKPTHLTESMIAMRRLSRIARFVCANLRVDVSLEVAPRMAVFTLERVTMEGRRSGWICIFAKIKRIYAKGDVEES